MTDLMERPPEQLPALPEQLRQLAQYIGQMARILDIQQQRIDALEQDQAMRITINHQQAKGLQARIRERAAQICGQYGLDERVHGAAIRSAIKRAALQEYGIRDLHDLPLGLWRQCGEMIADWTDFGLVQKRRRIDRHAG